MPSRLHSTVLSRVAICLLVLTTSSAILLPTRAVAATAPGVTFSANPQTISAGHSSTLSWTTSNATSVSIAPGIGTVATSGSKSVSPTKTTTYTLTATGAGGTKQANVTT